VSGVLSPDKSDPKAVFSKDGKRPVLSPQSPKSWAPKSGPLKAQVPFDAPWLVSGKPIYFKMTSIKLRTFVVPGRAVLKFKK